MTALNRDCRLDLGMGSEVPNELRDNLRSFVDGVAERWCMNWVESASGDLSAGISMVLWL